MKKLALFVVLSFWFLLSVYAYNSTDTQSANYLAGKGYIVDNSANPDEYRLEDNITRKEIMKVIAKLGWVTPAEKCDGKFTDVSDDWGCKYIEWALGQGIIAANTNFRPDDNITKAEAMKMIMNVKGIEKTYEWEVWQENYMNTAFDACIVDSVSGYNSNAARKWIFNAAYNTEETPECNDQATEDELEAILDELFQDGTFQ